MSILEYLFDNPVGPFHDPMSPRALQQEMAARSLGLARRMKTVDRKRTGEIGALRSAVARLMLVVETQQRLLLEKGLCTRAEFESMLHAVDLDLGAEGRHRRRR